MTPLSTITRFIFRTRDGLEAIAACPHIEATASTIMRPLKPFPPRYEHPDGQTYRDGGSVEYRRYKWHGELRDGLRVMEEGIDE